MAFFHTGKDHTGARENEHSSIKEEENGSDAIQEETIDCNRCKTNGPNSVANAFCPICFDFLCQTCKTEHQQSYADHCVITDDFRRCCDYVKLKIQISATYLELTQMHNDAENNMDLAEMYRDEAFKETHKERENINKMFDEQKVKVNSELDDLEAEIKTKIVNKYQADNEKFKYVIKEIESLKTDVQILTQNYDSLQQTQNTFFDSMTTCQKELATIKLKVKQVVAHNGVTKYRFEPTRQQNTTNMTVAKLGTIQTLDPQKATAAVNFICDINVNSATDTEFCNIKGMCFLSKHLLVVSDSQNKSIKVLDMTAQNTLVSTFSMPAGPRDVTQVKDTQIAVTLPSLQMIQVLNLNNNRTLSKNHDIPVNGDCLGIVHNQGKLFISFDIPTSHIQILDMNGATLKNFYPGHSAGNLDSPSSFAGIGLSPDHRMIYIADEDRETITCMTTEGKIKAIYRDANFEKPCGLTVACSGLVYVSGKGTVHEFSADLGQRRLVLDRSHGIHAVQCLLYCENENALYTGMIRQNVIKKFKIL